MTIDERIVQNGINPKLIIQLIQRHQKKSEHYSKLDHYYKGQHGIFKRQRENADLPNNHIMCNYAKYITDMSSSYLLGSPVSYSAMDEYDITPITDAYYSQTIAQTDTELAKEISKFGKCYEIVYADEQAQPKSTIITPHNGFIVYDNTVDHKKLFGVHYYTQLDLNGDVKNYSVSVYDNYQINTYHTQGDSMTNLIANGSSQHFFGGVPMIEYINNREEQGDYEQLISLIDAYNILQSDRINDKEQYVDAFLLLLGIEVDTDTARALKREKILLGEKDGKAEYLCKTLSEADVEILRNSINRDIHKFSLVPDMTDEKFSGNLSGVAIRYKLIAFEQHTKNKERYFEMGLKQRFELYNHFLNVKQNMPLVDVTYIDCIFGRNLPVNELEVSQMITNLKGVVSDETLLGQVPFVTDPSEEAEIVRKQTQEKEQKQAEIYSGLGGYDEDTNAE